MNSVERVKLICKERKIPISKLEKDLGFANGYIGQLKKGSFPDDRLSAIADYFGVTVDYLMTGEEPNIPKLPKGAIPVDISEFVKIPIVGSIRCGKPMFEESNIEGYEYVSVDDMCKGETYFYLRAKGDSMINAGINQGDLLLIRAQSDVDSGDIAVVNVNGDEETLKRVVKKDKAIILQPENTAYETKIFIGKELSLLHIQGRLMSVLKKF
jgi:SOS-response transcriptional repressors (RecA-mediated autopeptidases)